jgi:RNA polymerase sigma-70 factor, ECF subfamily
MSTADMPTSERPRDPAGAEPERDLDLNALLGRVADGDQGAFEVVYDRLAGPVFGLVYTVLRDPAQSEEVAQEVLLEVWRQAGQFDPARGNARTWVMTIAHRRAVDRVRSASAEARRERESTAVLNGTTDEVAEQVESIIDSERVRRCLESLTEIQRESVVLTYYGGYTCRDVAGILHVALPTIKTRIRDGLLRMRDCMGVAS